MGGWPAPMCAYCYAALGSVVGGVIVAKAGGLGALRRAAGGLFTLLPFVKR